MKPIRIQRKRQKGWKMPPNTIYVGRPGPWGNPFIIGWHGSPGECVAKYADYLLPYRHSGATSGMEKFLYSQVNMENIQEHLRGKNLACWCPLEQPCHADFLLEIANGQN